MLGVVALRRLSRLALIEVAGQSLPRMQGFAEPHHARPPATAVPVTARVVGDPVTDPTATTLKLYAGDWARFVAWCREQGCPALPASSETLARVCFTDRPFGSEDLTQ
jgi:hypothetical protein